MVEIEGSEYNFIRNANTGELLLAKDETIHDFAWTMGMLGTGSYEIMSYSPGEQDRPDLRRDYDIFFCESQLDNGSSILVKFNYANSGVNITLEVFERTLIDPAFENVNDYLRDNRIPVYVFVPGEEGQEGTYYETPDVSYPLYDWMELE
tara:strand:- start:182 stop:631 length:450 start_codon:yes stop_codon:yes gene_type:complete